jgi:hypothetical protein
LVDDFGGAAALKGILFVWLPKMIASSEALKIAANPTAIAVGLAI